MARKKEGKERGKNKAQIWRWEGMIGNSVRLTFVWFFSGGGELYPRGPPLTEFQSLALNLRISF